MQPSDGDPNQATGKVEDDRSRSDSKRGRVSTARGLAYAAILAMFGATVPFVAFSAVSVARWAFAGYLWIDVQDDFRHMPTRLGAAAVGCALVFGLAAFANYTPPQRVGLLRSIALVGASTIAGAFFVSILSDWFGLGPRSYFSDPYRGLRIGVFILVPCLFTVVLTRRRITAFRDST
jgi:hypothetical protein